MHSAIYCPYTNSELQAHEKNIEHIIPLSLGGSNQFTMPVNAKFNAEAGSKIDAVLANDFLLLLGASNLMLEGILKRSHPQLASNQH